MKNAAGMDVTSKPRVDDGVDEQVPKPKVGLESIDIHLAEEAKRSKEPENLRRR